MIDSALLSLRSSIILRLIFILGALLEASGLCASALAAHLPQSVFVPAVSLILPDGRTMLHTAANMAQGQGMALCLMALGAPFLRARPLILALFGMALGVCLFCVTVTLRAFGWPCWPRLAPLGGTLLILSWLALPFALPAFSKSRSKTTPS